MKKPLTYASSGVDYAGGLDSFKILCQARAELTSNNASRLGFQPILWSRGESVYLLNNEGRRVHHRRFGVVEEGLGTKNLVADAMRDISNLHQHGNGSHYHGIAQDTVAMIVNDMATLGIRPVTVSMHLAVASSEWFDDKDRAEDLINGWGESCDLARCVWAGGETPILKDILIPGTSLISGSAFGIAPPMRPINPSRIADGDAIIILESSGIHANGLTLAREIGNLSDEEKQFYGYAERLSDGDMYGLSLLTPTHIYSDFVEDCLEAGVDIHYCVNITGHGWRKFMRATQPFAYVIEELPRRLPIFDFICEHGPVTLEEAYATFNMGAGFALYIHPDDVRRVMEIAKGYKHRYRAINSGHIEKSDVKKVVIKPLRLEFLGDTLTIR